MVSPAFWKVFYPVAGAIAGVGVGLALAALAIVAAIVVINMFRG